MSRCVKWRSRIRARPLHLLSGVEFERLCGRLFEALGYAVSYTPASGDRGIDLELQKDGRLVLVQCKRQQATVGEPAFRDFFGVVTRSGAEKGIFCTNGSFSTRAETWVSGTRVELLDGAELVKLWRQYAVDVPRSHVPPSALQGTVARDDNDVRQSQRVADCAGQSRAKPLEARRARALRKWEAAGCEPLGIPRPDGPTDYTKIDGIAESGIYIGPDGRGLFVVVRAGTVLFASPRRAEAMEFYDQVK